MHKALETYRVPKYLVGQETARSPWVNEEILEFKRLGREDRIFSLIIGGEPYASLHPEQALEECFPEALRFKLRRDGRLGCKIMQQIPLVHGAAAYSTLIKRYLLDICCIKIGR